MLSVPILPKLLDQKTNDWEVGFLMAKYSYKCKKQIVKEYVKGNGSDYVLAKKYGVPSDGQVRIWVAAYKKWGDDGLKRLRERRVCSDK